MNQYRVPILREVDSNVNESDPDHIRGVKNANLLLGTDYGKGDVVEVVFLDRVGDEFFQRVESEPDIADDPLYRQFKRDLPRGEAVVCIDDTDLLPEEFDRDPVKSPGDDGVMTEKCCVNCGTVMETFEGGPTAPSSVNGGYCDDCKEELGEVECSNCGRSYKPDLEPDWSESVIPVGRCSDCWPGAMGP